MTTSPTYVLRLRAIPGRFQADPHQRLRRVLKTLLRTWGFRCVTVETITEPPVELAPNPRPAEVAS